jgi:hypothetical protein
MFVAEDAGASRPPTEITAEWLNSVQEEIVNVILNAGLVLDVAQQNQLLAAINSIAAAKATQVLQAWIGGAPVALDTLLEFATALGNDPNFATTIVTLLGGKQPLDATLTALAGVNFTANKLLYSTGPDAFAMTDLSAYARSLLDDIDAAAARSTLGITVGLGLGYMLVRDEKAQGTDGGTTVGNTTATRVLNTLVDNTISGASLASNQITLPAGTYRFRGRAPISAGNTHKAYLYNVTAGAVAIYGTAENGSVSTADDLSNTYSEVVGRISLAAPAVFEVRHFTSSSFSGLGWGNATNIAGMNEIYTVVEIIKEA